VSTRRNNVALRIEQLIAQIALLQAGNEVLRRTNAKLIARLSSLPRDERNGSSA
jgi:cell division protein FtsB